MVTTLPAPARSSSATPDFTRPTFLMCSPEFYGVDYVHNPWMAGALHRFSRDAAFQQWRGLYDALQRVADVKLLHPQPDCPDMVFLAHGAVVHHGLAALSSFSHTERRRETPYLRTWMEDHGFLLWETARETAFEGEGDAAFDPERRELWAAHGSRTCRSAHRHVADAWHVPVRSLHLTDPRFYHLDTCFTLLPNGHLLYFPAAFDSSSLAQIEHRWAVEKRVAVTEADAVRLGCSALAAGRNLFVGRISDLLCQELERRGFSVVRMDLDEFLKGGGGARALALRLNDLETTP